MKKLVRLLFIAFIPIILFIVVPYCLQWYGLIQLNKSLEESMDSFETYEKGWEYLEKSKLFLFWGNSANKHQESNLLQAKILFFEERISCQIETEKEVNSWLAEESRTQNDKYFVDSLREVFFKWKHNSDQSIDELPQELQEKITTIHHVKCMDCKQKWQEFLNWTSSPNKALSDQVILSRMALEDHRIQFLIDYSANYLLKGY